MLLQDFFFFCVYHRRTWDEFKRVLSVAHASQPVERAENLEYRNQLSGVCWGAVYFSIESIFLNHLYFRLRVSSCNSISHTIVMLSHCISTQSPPFIISWEELFSFLLISFRVLCYQSSRLYFLHLAIFFMFVVDNILLQRCKQLTVARRRIPLI
jgi:hypothetical protein